MDESIAVVGLGNVGHALAAVITDKGLKIVGVDANHERCEHASLLVPSVISILHAIEYWLTALSLLSTIHEPAVKGAIEAIKAGNNGIYSSSLLTAIQVVNPYPKIFNALPASIATWRFPGGS